MGWLLAMVSTAAAMAQSTQTLPDAVLYGQTKTVQDLLTAGADVNAKDDTGMTPLMVAAVQGHAAIAQLLMTHALAAVSAAIAGIVSQLTVVMAFALGFALNGDPISSLSLVGAIMTLTGVTVAARGRPPPNHAVYPSHPTG